jgi:hypothetical protein
MCRYILSGSAVIDPFQPLFTHSRPFLFRSVAQPVSLSQKVSVLGDSGLFWRHFSHKMVLHSVRIGRHHPVPTRSFTNSRPFQIRSIAQSVFIVMKGEYFGYIG